MQELDIEEELRRFEAAERARLGLEAEKTPWTDAMVDPFFGKSQKAHTTILVGGLTMAQDYLVEGVLSGLGYRVKALDAPDHEALRYGKEFGNRGQCNPTYFTVGNLVKSLDAIRVEKGMTHQEVIDSYVFLTAGSCGPCRFGMYVTEYRKALRDAGFDGFRVLLFQHAGGLKQATGEESGLELNPTFFLGLGKAIFIGDILNLITYRLRPYEVEEGATDRAMQEAKDAVYAALSTGGSLLAALWTARQAFGKVKLDRLRPKPKVSIIGEFWAMTTEGEGNYELQRFLEGEGAEVDIQVLANWILYCLWEVRNDTRDRAYLKGADDSKFGLADSDVGLTMAGLYLGEWLLNLVWQSWAKLAGLHGHHLPDMDVIADAADAYYNKELRGGEGHMEVGKLVLNVEKRKTHMTVSVKPFGCMPSSSVSDGIQSVVTERYPDAIFCPVETSGDGAVNFYSRVQMFLFKARQRAREEYDAALAEHGVTEAQVRAFLDAHPGYESPFFKAPHRAAGSGADLVHHVAPLVGKGRLGRAAVHARRAVETARHLVKKDLPARGRKLRTFLPYAPALLRFAAAEAQDAMPGWAEAKAKILEKLFTPAGEATSGEPAPAEEPFIPASSLTAARA